MRRRVPLWYYRDVWMAHATPESLRHWYDHHAPKAHPAIKPNRRRTHRSH